MNDAIMDIQELKAIADRIRIKVVKMIAISGIGHVGGSVSIAEILTVLYFHEMNIDRSNPNNPNRDRFVLSKGHGCPALYAVFSEIGYVPADWLPTLHDVDSPLQMHPERGLCPGIEVSTGALGQGLSAGIGIAIGARLRGLKLRVYVVLGDGESNEGQVWEAAMCASKYQLDNLVTILDYNKFNLSGRTQTVMPLEPLSAKWLAFGWHVIEANGHSIPQLINALSDAKQIKGKPTLIIAHTVKGHGIPAIEDKVESHSVVFPVGQVEKALRDIGCSEQEIAETMIQIKEKN